MTGNRVCTRETPVLLGSIHDVRVWHAAIEGDVGLVPTMGALHDGHLALIRRARSENDAVIASIFVNPTQFGPIEDFQRYPRTLDRDMELLRREGVDAVFVPSVEELYPPGSTTRVHVRGISERLEGASRPEHFIGVATIVAKLFNICQTDRAYFGQKDAQQVAVIRRMVKDLDVSVEIVPVETVRDTDGLAVSSRNVYLSDEERRAAAAIPTALAVARERFEHGERKAWELIDAMLATIAAEPLLRIDYVRIVDPDTFEGLANIDDTALVLVAVYIGQTRLIDNVRLDVNQH